MLLKFQGWLFYLRLGNAHLCCSMFDPRKYAEFPAPVVLKRQATQKAPSRNPIRRNLLWKTELRFLKFLGKCGNPLKKFALEENYHLKVFEIDIIFGAFFFWRHLLKC